MDGSVLGAEFARTHARALRLSVTTRFNVGRIFVYHYGTEHHVATLNRGEGKEGLRKVPIRKYIPERISLKGGGKEG